MRHERQAFDAMSAWASRCTLIENARMFYGTNSLRDGTECRRNEEHRQPFDFCFYGPIAAIGFFYSSTDSASLPSRRLPYRGNPMHFRAISALITHNASDTKSIARTSIHRHHWRCGNSPARAPNFVDAKFRTADQCATPIYFPRRWHRAFARPKTLRRRSKIRASARVERECNARHSKRMPTRRNSCILRCLS